MVNRALRTLLGAIRDGRLPPPPTELFNVDAMDPIADPVIGVQRLVRNIAKAYRLDVGSVTVTYREMEQAGLVTLGRSRDFLVDVRKEYQGDIRLVAAVLAHEVAHIFLHRHDLRFEVTLENEILTDTAASIYGFGHLMLDTFRVKQTGHEWTATKMGYLTPEEYGLLLAKMQRPGAGALIRSDAALKALQTAVSRAKRDRALPPLAAAPWWRRLRYRLASWWAARQRARTRLTAGAAYAFEDNNVVFGCPRCGQELRLPRGRTITYRCTGCALDLACRT